VTEAAKTNRLRAPVFTDQTARGALAQIQIVAQKLA
jgi:hypothetical protein